MQDKEQTVDPLVQQMIKADALVVTLAQVRDDLRKQADQIDAVIKMTEAQDQLTGMADALQGGAAASKTRLLNLLRQMKPELANASDEEVLKHVGGIK